jgi:hypothetical protein
VENNGYSFGISTWIVLFFVLTELSSTHNQLYNNNQELAAPAIEIDQVLYLGIHLVEGFITKIC